MSDLVANVAPSFPDCWLTVGDGRELRCWGRLDADADRVVDVWLWFTGTDGAVDLADDERRSLWTATAVRLLPEATAADRERLARRIGRRRLQSESESWGMWWIPVDQLESVLARALTRSARAGRLHPPIVA